MSRWTMADVVEAQMRQSHAKAQELARQNNRAQVTKPKYGNQKTNGYASKREAKRAQELKALEKAGKIFELQEQVKFELIPKQDGERACHYIADFTYLEQYKTVDSFVVEDAKGYRDPIYRIKRKLMLQVHGIRVREV